MLVSRSLSVWVTVLIALGCRCTATASADDSDQRARAILDAAAFRGGLVVHVECGEGNLTAALCAGDGCLVQGLCSDGRDVQAARRHVQSLGLLERVSIDTFTTTDASSMSTSSTGRPSSTACPLPQAGCTLRPRTESS